MTTKEPMDLLETEKELKKIKKTINRKMAREILLEREAQKGLDLSAIVNSKDFIKRLN